jgi:hypothetical protein
MHFIIIRKAPNLTISEADEHIMTLQLKRVHIGVSTLTFTLQIFTAYETAIDIQGTQ